MKSHRLAFYLYFLKHLILHPRPKPNWNTLCFQKESVLPYPRPPVGLYWFFFWNSLLYALILSFLWNQIKFTFLIKLSYYLQIWKYIINTVNPTMLYVSFILFFYIVLQLILYIVSLSNCKVLNICFAFFIMPTR